MQERAAAVVAPLTQGPVLEQVSACREAGRIDVHEMDTLLEYEQLGPCAAADFRRSPRFGQARALPGEWENSAGSKKKEAGNENQKLTWLRGLYSHREGLQSSSEGRNPQVTGVCCRPGTPVWHADI